jgi:plastocyanin domain-containing protein
MKSIKKIIFLKSLTAIFCIGLFAFNLENSYISNEKLASSVSR